MTLTLSVWWCGFGAGYCAAVGTLVILAWLLGRYGPQRTQKPG